MKPNIKERVCNNKGTFPQACCLTCGTGADVDTNTDTGTDADAEAEAEDVAEDVADAE